MSCRSSHRAVTSSARPNRMAPFSVMRPFCAPAASRPTANRNRGSLPRRFGRRRLSSKTLAGDGQHQEGEPPADQVGYRVAHEPEDVPGEPRERAEQQRAREDGGLPERDQEGSARQYRRRKPRRRLRLPPPARRRAGPASRGRRTPGRRSSSRDQERPRAPGRSAFRIAPRSSAAHAGRRGTRHAAWPSQAAPIAPHRPASRARMPTARSVALTPIQERTGAGSGG